MGELRGRRREREVLEAAADRLAAGRGGALWVEGEAGIGKSALIAVAAERAQGAGCHVARAAAAGGSEPFPLLTLVPGLGRLPGVEVDAIGRVARLLRGEESAGDPVLAAGELILELIDRVCARGPVLLLVEDAQWADEASCVLLERLVRAVDQIPLLVVVTARAVGDREPVRRVAEAVRECGTALSLDALDERDVAALAADEAGAPPDARLLGELERAGGNPLFVTELMAALKAAGRIELVDGAAVLRGEAQVLPETVAAVIETRLAVLGPRARRLLELAAVIGPAVDARLLATVAGVPLLDLTTDLEAARGAGILVPSGHGSVFRHELFRQVLTRHLGPDMLGLFHTRIARALADAGHGVDAVARHLLASGPVEGWAVDWLCRIPRTALAAAPAPARDLLDRASGTLATADGRRPLLEARLTEALFLLGLDQEVVERAVRTAVGEGGEAMDARLLTARAMGRLGRFADGLAYIGDVLAARPPARWVAIFEAQAALMHLHSGARDAARASAQRALEAAARSGDALAEGYARHAASYNADPAEALEHVDLALAGLGGDAQALDLRLMLLTHRMELLSLLADTEGLRRQITEALALAERAGSMRMLSILAMAAELAFWEGEWDATLAYTAQMRQDFPPTPYLTTYEGMCALICTHRAERDAALAHLEQARILRGTEEMPGHYARAVVQSRVLLEEAGGDTRAALALAATLLEPAADASPNARLDDVPDLVRLALEHGERQTAASAVAFLEKWAAQEPDPAYAEAGQMCRAMLEDDPDALMAASRRLTQLRRPLHAGLAAEEAAVRLAADGHGEKARAALDEAVGCYESLAAVWDVRRADGRLRALGVRRGPRSEHRRETAGAAALTPAEQRVAALVARGWSNPQIGEELFVSRRTVQSQVSSILRKLGLTSRHEVAESLPRAEPARQRAGA